MTDQEIRAKALELTVATIRQNGEPNNPQSFLERLLLFETYIRLGSQAIEGMLKP